MEVLTFNVVVSLDKKLRRQIDRLIAALEGNAEQVDTAPLIAATDASIAETAKLDDAIKENQGAA